MITYRYIKVFLTRCQLIFCHLCVKNNKNGFIYKVKQSIDILILFYMVRLVLLLGKQYMLESIE
jgi:hypothetical protein